MERIDTAVIDKIRDGLINRYDKDQQMQQLIEEIGAEENLNEQELAIVYQAYLEVKERMQYTANLVELWNQIETVQHRMELLHTYDSLENDLLGDDVINHDSSDDNAAYTGHGNAKPLGYGAGKSDNHNYTMEQVELHEVEPVTMDTVFDAVNHVDNESALQRISDDTTVLDEEHLDTTNVDESNHTTLDPFDLMTAMFAEEAKQSKKVSKDKKASKTDKHSDDRSKEQKKIDKLLKKQMKRIEKEWAKISGKLDKDEKKSKSKEDKIVKKAAKEAEKSLAKQEKSAKKEAKKLEKAAKKAEKQELKKSGKKKKA